MGSPFAYSHRIWRRGRNPPRICVTSLFLAALCVSSVLSDREPYRTAYGCEGATLSIACEPGHVINVIRANYGRFSITICNAHGNTDWSVNCHSPHTKNVLQRRCTGKNACRLGVSSELFGDPCPRTRKYIEVHYNCGLATTTTSTTRPRPPWFVNAQEPVWGTPRVNASSSSEVSPKNLSSLLPHPSTPPPIPSTTPSTTASSTTTMLSTTTEHPTTTSTTTSSLSSSSSEWSLERHHHQSSTVSSVSYTDDDRPRSSQKGDPVPTKNTADKVVSKKFSDSDDVFVRHPTQKTVEISTNSWNEVKSVPVTPPDSEFRFDVDSPWCSPTFARGLNWNWTKSGDIAVLACPGGATGTARRKCLSGKWESLPDLSECRSAWLTALNKRASNHDDSVLAVVTDLAKVTASKELYGGDLITAARLIRTLSRRMMEDVTSAFPEPQQRQAVVTEFLLSALETGSALLSAGLIGPWGDLSPKERRYAVTELMIGLEESAFLLGDVLTVSSQALHFQSHILTSARSLAPDGSFVNFPSNNDLTSDWVFTDNVLLPPEAILENSEGGATRVVFLAYRHLEDLLSLDGHNLNSFRNRNASLIVNSRIVSASLGKGRHIQLPEPVSITFSLLKFDNVSNPVCAFWDYTTYTWSDEGCVVYAFNRSHVSCKCDHLTNFAVIMQEYAPDKVEEGMPTPRIMAYVGCFLCTLCAASHLLVFTVFNGESCVRFSVRKHVSALTLMAELAFLIGAWRTDLPVLCGLTAAVLFYAVLSTFSWMCFEGVQIYLFVSQSDGSGEGSRLRWWHVAVNYGFPLLVVSCSALAHPSGFGSRSHCGLRSDDYFALVAVGPCAALAVVETALLAAASFSAWKTGKDDDVKPKPSASLASARLWLKSGSALLLTASSTWGLGLVVLYESSLPLAVAFCLLNTALGAVIFLDHCFRSQKVPDHGSGDEPRSSALQQLFRSVFAADKQTYSPNNLPSSADASSNNNNYCSGPSTHNARPGESVEGPRPGTGNGGLQYPPSSAAAAPQFLPTLFQSRAPKSRRGGGLSFTGYHEAPPAMSGGGGSRGSLRHVGTTNRHFGIPMGALHQSLPRTRSGPPPAHHHTHTASPGGFPLGPHTSLNDEDASYKSSRDSGHGGSEQEDSPRTPWTGHRGVALPPSSSHSHSHTLSGDLRGPASSKYGFTVASSTHLSPALAAVLRANNAATLGYRGQSPFNHTYMEIESSEPDPVYEEVDRSGRAPGSGGGTSYRTASSLYPQQHLHHLDYDETCRSRGPPSDLSRHSSRSYGDARPLLYHQTQDPGAPFGLSEDKLRDFNEAQMCRDLEQLHTPRRHFSRDNLVAIAVLNGEQVVCQLGSPTHPHPQPSAPIYQPAASHALPIIREGGQQRALPTEIADPAQFVAPRYTRPVANEC